MTIISSSNANLTPDKWHNVSFTYNRFTSNVNILVDNVSVGQAEDVLIDLTKTNTNFALGYSSNQEGEKFFTGAMDDISIYNRQLTSDELTYLYSSNQNFDLFLKNQLSGNWSLDQFVTTANTFFDQNGTSLNTIGSGVSQGTSSPLNGVGSVSLDGSSHMSASGVDLDTSFMGYGTWVKPTSHNASFIKKDGVFSLGTDASGKPVVNVGGVSSADSRFIKSAVDAPEPKYRLLFDETLNDVKGNVKVKGENVSYSTPNYNSDSLNRAIVHAEDTEINMGNVLDKVKDANQLTMSMWINPSELNMGEKYPLMSTNNGFEWYVDNDGSGQVRLNFQQVDNTLSGKIDSFEVKDGEATVKLTFSNVTSNREVRTFITTEKYDTRTTEGIKKLIEVGQLITPELTGSGGVSGDVASEQINGTASGTTLNSSDGSSSIISGYYQNLPSGDKIHSSSSFQSSRAVSSLFDGYSGSNGGNWNNAWHGASGATTLTAVYEFSSGSKTVGSMDFVNVPSSHHAGVINIYYWNGSSFVEVNYTNDNQFANNNDNGELNVTFDAVTSSQFKIQVNRHSSNGTSYVGLSGWTIYNVAVASIGVPAPPLTEVKINKVVSQTTLFPLNSVNHGYLYVLHTATDGLKETKIMEDDSYAKDQIYDPEAFTLSVGGTPATPAVIDSSEQGKSSNSSLEQTLYDYYNDNSDTVFDYITTYSSSPVNKLGKITLANGDNFYAPTVSSANDGASQNIGKYMDGGNFPHYNRPNIKGVDVGSASGNNGFVWYYEPSYPALINKIILTFGGHHGTEWIHQVGYVLDGEYTEASNVKINNNAQTLPFSINSSGNDITVTFDPVVAGPERPLKFVITQNNNNIQLYKMAFEFEGELSDYTSLFNGITATVKAPKQEIEEEEIDYKPLITLLPYFENFDNFVKIGGTVFSAYKRIFKIYTPVMFVLSDDFKADIVTADYAKNYIKNNNVSSQTINLPKRTVHRLDYTVTSVIDNTGAQVPVSLDNTHIAYIMIVESTGEEHVLPLGGVGAGGLSIPVMDWSQTLAFSTTNDTGDTQISKSGSYSRGMTPLSGDGKVFVMSNSSSGSAGWVRVYYYNDETDEWGKFDANGTFTKDQYHNLDKSGVQGSYATSHSMSADGKSLALGGHTDHYRGSGWVWQYDDSTAEWGKWNADGSFTAGTPHTVGDHTSSTWPDGHPYCHYGYCSGISANGKRAVFGGHYNDNNRFRFYVWDYDESTATWGGYDSSGTFVENKPYMVYKSGASWGYGGLCISMSYDGNKILFTNYTSSTAGKAGIMCYNEETYQWGKLEANGAFTAHTGDGNSGKDDHYNLDLSGIHSYYGMRSKIAGDGKSALVGGYHHHAHGNQAVWQFNEETYEWGKFGPNYESFTAGTPHKELERSGNVGHQGHCVDISADGRTVLTSGHWRAGHWENKMFLWQYNPETAEWGKFNADGSFEKPTSTGDHSRPWMHSSTDTFTSGCALSGDGSTFMGIGNNKTRIWRGVIVEPEYTVVPYSGGASSGSGGGLTIGTLSELTTELESVVFEELKGGSGGGISVHDTDWTETTNSMYNSSGDYLIPAGGNSRYPLFSADGTRLLIHSHTSSSAGEARLWEYDEESDSWGKFDASGSFTQGQYHNLDQSSTRGHYALSAGISCDGNTIGCGGYVNHGGTGHIYVWKYDESTATWGKFTADGSFVAEPYKIEDTTGWNGYFPQGQRLSFSADGKKLLCGCNGHSSNGRIYIFDYDEETAHWGRLYADGTFKEFKSGDHTTYYMIYTNNSGLGYDASMAGDGKTLSVSRHTSNNHGHCYVMKFDEETREWGRWNADGSFTAITTDSNGQHSWSSSGSGSFYYDLERNSTVMHYGGRPMHFSQDGKTMVIAYHHNHTRGRGYIWYYNDEVHEWGRWEADGSFKVPTSNTDNNEANIDYVEYVGHGHYGTTSSISADGKTLFIGGNWQQGNGHIWELDEVSRKWGGFDASGTNFTEGVSGAHHFYHGSSAYFQRCDISPNNLFVAVTSSTSNIHVYKGVSRGERIVVPYGVGGGGTGGAIAPPLVFTGSVKPDKNLDTNYYVIATLKDNLSNSQVRDMINNPAFASALLTEPLEGKEKKFSKEKVSFVIDENDNIVPSYKVNRANLYLYATDGDLEHDDIVGFLAATTFAGDLYSVITSVNYNKFLDISTMYASIMSSADNIAKYYIPLPFTANVDITRLHDIKQFIIDNSQAVSVSIQPNVVVDLPPLQVNVAYDNLYDASQTTTIDVSKASDYSFFMVVEDSEGNTELSYATFNPGITSVSEIGAKIEEATMSHVYDEDNEEAVASAILEVHDTDWSNETTDNDQKNNGDYTLNPGFGTTHNYLRFGTNRLITYKHVNNNSGKAYVYDYNTETDEWGKFDASGSFTKDQYHDLSKSSTQGHYAYRADISLDDKTILIGGYYDHQGKGAMFVWHYNEETAEWGKWNADGSFTSGTPHDLSNTSNNWSGYYGYARQFVVSADGKRIFFGCSGHSHNGRLYIMDYDDETAAWGRKYVDGTFKPYVVNDFSTMIIIETGATSIGYYSTMSKDGKTISAGRSTSNTHGYVYVWKYNEETMQWGKWNSDGSFTPISKNGDDTFNGKTSNAYWDLERNSASTYYGGGNGGHHFSVDGNTLGIISYHANGQGRTYIWQYNTETHEWGKFNLDGTFVKPTSVSDHSGVTVIYSTGNGHIGHGGTMTADGKSLVMSGHNGGGTAFIWEYDDATGKWGGFNAAGSFTENSPHRLYSGASNWGHDSSISLDNRFVHIEYNGHNIQIFKGVSRGIRSEVAYSGAVRKSELKFKGEAYPSDTEDSISQYYLMTTTNHLTPAQARTLFTDVTKSAAIIVGPEDGFTSKVKINTKIPNAITEDGTIVPISVVNNANIYLYSKELGAPINVGYEDMERLLLEPYNTRPFVVVNIVQSSFSNELQIAGSVFSAYSDIDKVYVLLYKADVDLSEVSNATFKATAEANVNEVPEMTLTTTDRYNLGVFSTVPTKVINNSNALSSIIEVTQPPNYALQMLTNGQIGNTNSDEHSAGFNHEISPNAYYSVLLRFKTTSSYTPGTFFAINTGNSNSAAADFFINDSNSSAGYTFRVQWSQYLGKIGQGQTQAPGLSSDTWYTVVARIKSNAPVLAFVNEFDISDHNSEIEFHVNRTFSAPVNMTQIQVNNGQNGMSDLDYLVIVPDDLNTTQLASVYNDYENDIQGFLDANSLTPTVKYLFNNNTNNEGTQQALPTGMWDGFKTGGVNTYVEIDTTSAPLEYADVTAYQVRVVAIDTDGQVTVQKPATENDGDFEITTSMSVVIDKVEKTPLTLDFEATMTLVDYKYYDYYAIAITQPDSKTNVQIRDMLFNEYYNAAVVLSENEKDKTMKVSLTHVIDSVNNTLVLATQVNAAQVFVYVKANGTIVGGGYEDIAKFDFTPMQELVTTNFVSTDTIMSLDIGSYSGEASIKDSSGQGNNATVHNGTLGYGEDADGKYIEFDGTSTSSNKTYIELDHSTLFRNSSSGSNEAFTFDISFKIKEDYDIADEDSIYYGHGGMSRLHIYPSPANATYDYARWQAVFGGNGEFSETMGEISKGSIQRHTWVYNGTNIKMYVNGSKMFDKNADFYSMSSFYINAQTSTSASSVGRLPMKLYGVNHIHKALSDEELASLWNIPIDRTVSMSLDIASYDGETSVTDVSGNNNNATIHNGTLTSGEDSDGKYIEFDGTSTSTNKTYIELDHTLLNENAFTFDIVFKINEGYTLVASPDDNIYQGAGPDARLYVHPTNGDFAFGGAGGSSTKVHPNGAIPIGTLERHTWVWDGTTLNVYHNANTTPFHTYNYTFKTPTEMFINAADSSSSEYHYPATGRIPFKLYGVQIYNKALSTDELTTVWDTKQLLTSSHVPSALSSQIVEKSMVTLQVPHASVAVAEYIPFQNKIQVTAATGYSQFNNIVGMYPVIAFGKDVDLEEEPDKVYQFIIDNFEETSVDLPAYAVNSIPNLPADITLAFNDLTDASVTVPVDEHSQLRMLMRDATATPLLTTAELLAPQPGPYQLWFYMLDSSHDGTINLLNNIFIYDTANPWSSEDNTENGTRLSFTVDYDNYEIHSHANPELLSWDYDLSGVGGTNHTYENSKISETDPVLKLGNIDTSVRSILLGFYRPKYAFNFKLELRDANEELITTFTSSNMVKDGMGDPTNVSTMLTASHSVWNIIGSGGGYVVYDTDWSQTTDNQADYEITMPYAHSYVRMSAGEIHKVLIARHINNGSGYCWVYDYNEETDEWGKFNSDGSFSANTYHNLNKSGVTGHYGLTSGISLDGKTIVVGGYSGSTNGCMYVWQWDNETKAWGKWNADKSFTAGEPHDLSIDGSSGVHYGHNHRSYVSHDGKRVATGGHGGSYHRIYIWDYDEETAQWGKIEQSTGTFIARNSASFLPNWITTPSDESQGRCMSADGCTIIACRHLSNTTGKAYAWKYNKDTYEWGKFNTDGSFTKDAYWDLSQSGVYAHYGLSGEVQALSADGKTAAIGGYHNSSRGGAVIWHYNEDTYEWGKWMPDGSFMAQNGTMGESYPQADGYWLEKTSGCGYFARSLELSADGLSLVISGYNGNTTWVYDYNPETAHWGRYDSTGAFIKWSEDTEYASGGHRIYNTVSQFGYYGRMSPDNKFVCSSHNTQNLAIYKGVIRGERGNVLGGSGSGTASSSALRTISSDPPTDDLVLWINPATYTSGDIIDTISENAVSPAYSPEDHTINDVTIKAWNYSTTAPASAGNVLSSPHKLSTTGGFTFARWVHFESGYTNWRRIFVDYSSHSAGAWYLTAKNDTHFVSHLVHGHGIKPNTSSDANDIDYNKWQLVIAVGNAYGFNTIYVIDADEALSATNLPLSAAVNTNNYYTTEIHFSHMTENSGSLGHPGGWIGDTYMYSKELSQVEVFNLWNVTRYKYTGQGGTNSASTEELPPLVTTGYSLGKYIGGSGGGLTYPVYNVDWSNETTSNDNTATGDYTLAAAGGHAHGYFAFGTNRFLSFRHANSSSGQASLYDYNVETDEWGKLSSDGSFTKNARHNFDKSGQTGHYGIVGAVSLDDSTIAVGGYRDHQGQGSLHVWKFNKDTLEWGKWNADGSFTAGESYDLTKSHTYNGYYAQGKLSLSHNGNRILIGGNKYTGTYGRIYVLDYNVETAEWGRFYPDGTFKKYDHREDFTTAYVMDVHGSYLYGHYSSISDDGNTIVSGRHINNNSGYTHVWKYNPETYEWGKWNADGSFTPLTETSNGRYDARTPNAYWDLYRTSTVCYYGMVTHLSSDGKTLLSGGYYDSSRGRAYIWQYDEVTAEWGKFNPDGSFVKPTSNTDTNSPHMIEKTSALGHWGHLGNNNGRPLSADGKTVFMGGHQGGGCAWLYEYDTVSGKWGGFNAAGVFTENSPHRFYNGSSNWAHGWGMSPDNRFVCIHYNSSNLPIFKGVIREDEPIRTEVSVSGSGGGAGGTVAYDSEIRCSITSIEFKNNKLVLNGELVADKDHDTNYYILATTKPLTTDEEKRAVANGLGHMNAVVVPEEIITAGSKEKLKSVEISYVVDNSYDDVNNYTMTPIDSVNVPYVHLYVSDGLTGHEDYDVTTIVPTRVVEHVMASSAIKTNSQAITLNLSPNVEISPNTHFTMMFRFKKHSGNGTPLIKMTANEAGRYYAIYYNSNLRYYFGSQDSDAYYVNNNNYTNNLENDKYHVAVMRIDEGEYFIGYWNDNRVDAKTNKTRDYNQSNIIIKSIEFAANSCSEIDYLVIVPDKLTEDQMASVYTDYEKDIEGFLTANDLTPTIKYCFDNYNTNAGTATDMPAISFQTPDVYTDISTYVPTTINDLRPKAGLQAVYTPFGGYFAVTATAFSSLGKVTKVYPVVAFSKDVDLSDEAAVIQFIKDNTTEQTVDYPQYKVSITTENVATMFNDLADGTNISNITETGAQIRSLIIDENGNEGVGIFIPGSGEGIKIPTVDWSQTLAFSTTNDGGDTQISKAGTYGYGLNLFSGDGKKLVMGSHTNQSSGWVRVYEYNEETDEWGKFDVSGSFTKDEYHDLSKSSTFGYYGMATTVSADGNTIATGGYYDHYRGCLYIWQFDEATAQWGKWNADGTHTAGTPHDLSSNTVPSTSWKEGDAHPYSYYGRNTGISADGKRVITGGKDNGASRIRFYVWDFDESTGTWGGYDTSGNFVENKPYMIHKTGAYNSKVPISMSYDGKRILFTEYIGNTSGNASIMFYNDDTYEWGKFTSSGFTAHTPGSNRSDESDYYQLNTSSFNSQTSIHSYYGMHSKISGDGNTALVGGYHHHAHGDSFVWQFNEATYEWGRFGPNYDSFTPGVPHYEQFPRNSGVGHHGHSLDISADGRSVVVSGHWRAGHWENKIFLWEYNPETAEWGRFNADGSFIKPTATGDNTNIWMHSSTDTFTSGCAISPDGSTILGMGNNKTRIWRGVIKEEERSFVTFDGSRGGGGSGVVNELASIQRATISSATFSNGIRVDGEVVADKEYDTEYFLIAFESTVDKTYEEVRSIINNNTYPTAVVSGTVSAGSKLALDNVSVSKLISASNTVVSSASYLEGKVYLYAKDGVATHDAIQLYTAGLARALEFEFDDGDLMDVKNIYTFHPHIDQKVVALGVDGTIELRESGSAAVVNLGNNYFTPYSFTLVFDYRTEEPVQAAERMLVSTASDTDNSSQVPGFHMRIYNTSLDFGLQKSTTEDDYYMIMNNVDVSNYDLSNFHRFVFKFSHSYNHTYGDKNSMEIYIDGNLVGSKDVESGALTQAERDAGVKFTNPNKLYLNKWKSSKVSGTSFYDNIRYYPYALTDDMITNVFELPPLNFNFDNATLYDVTNTYEIQPHSDLKEIALGVDGDVKLVQYGSSASINLGNNYFTPYSFTLSFDYKTDETSGNKMLVSSASHTDNGSDVPGFHVKIHQDTLYFGVQKSVTADDYYMIIDSIDVSNYDLSKYNHFVFKFTHSYNHAEGDKNNLEVYINGSLAGSKDAENGSLTQEERSAGIEYTNPNKLYLNKWKDEYVGADSYYDNIKFYREPISAEVMTQLLLDSRHEPDS